MPGDEDEGSSSREEANRKRAGLSCSNHQAASLETGKIDRSAEALRVDQPPDIFSLQNIEPSRKTPGNRAIKSQGVG
jgi:hypothetical protein